MLDLDIPEFNRQAMQHKKLQAAKCVACPFKTSKPEDANDSWNNFGETNPILIIHNNLSENLLFAGGFSDCGYTSLVECADKSVLGFSAAEICCMGRKLEMIKQGKPKVVVAVGRQVYEQIENALGLVPTSNEFSVSLLPCSYSGHKFWLVAVPEPEIITKNGKSWCKNKISDLFESPIFRDGWQLEPHVEKGSYEGLVNITDNGDIDDAFDYLLKNADYVAFDIETTGLNHLDKGADILSIAVGTTERTYAFPLLAHSQTPRDFDEELVWKRFFDLAKKKPLIGFNVIFELNWLAVKFGYDVLYAGTYHDVMAQSYLLSAAPKSLNAVTRRELGFDLKTMSSIAVDNLIHVPIDKVLTYNALDVKYTHKLFMRLKERITKQNMDYIYQEQIARIPSTALMGLKGITTNQDFIINEGVNVTGELCKSKLLEIKALSDVKAFEKKILLGGEFNVLSNEQLKSFFNFIGIYRSNFDKHVLASLDHPFAELLAEYRENMKVFGTYIEPMKTLRCGNNNGILYPDGRVHSDYQTMFTVTGRLSSRNPNLQNCPKALRQIYRADDNCLWLACDMGQIEWRIMVTLIQDPDMVEALNTNFDVHRYWAQQILGEFPHLANAVGDFAPCDSCKKEVRMNQDGKCPECEMRQFTKSKLVFASIFGSTEESVARSYGMTIEEFKPIWEKFHAKHSAIKLWHSSIKQSVKENGYVASPLGRKFYTPLSLNQSINYPIQGTASDLVVIAQSKLSRMAIEEKMPHLAPIMNTHDDLGFSIPVELLEESIPIIRKTMLHTETYKDWLKVPLTVEAAVGATPGSLSKIGTYDSREFGD